MTRKQAKTYLLKQIDILLKIHGENQIFFGGLTLKEYKNVIENEGTIPMHPSNQQFDPIKEIINIYLYLKKEYGFGLIEQNRKQKTT